jgi:hypothetical protein
MAGRYIILQQVEIASDFRRVLAVCDEGHSQTVSAGRDLGCALVTDPSITQFLLHAAASGQYLSMTNKPHGAIKPITSCVSTGMPVGFLQGKSSQNHGRSLYA